MINVGNRKTIPVLRYAAKIGANKIIAIAKKSTDIKPKISLDDKFYTDVKFFLIL